MGGAVQRVERRPPGPQAVRDGYVERSARAKAFPERSQKPRGVRQVFQDVKGADRVEGARELRGVLRDVSLPDVQPQAPGPGDRRGTSLQADCVARHPRDAREKLPAPAPHVEDGGARGEPFLDPVELPPPGVVSKCLPQRSVEIRIPGQCGSEELDFARSAFE